MVFFNALGQVRISKGLNSSAKIELKWFETPQVVSNMFILENKRKVNKGSFIFMSESSVNSIYSTIYLFHYYLSFPFISTSEPTQKSIYLIHSLQVLRRRHITSQSHVFSCISQVRLCQVKRGSRVPCRVRSHVWARIDVVWCHRTGQFLAVYSILSYFFPIYFLSLSLS